MRPGSVSKQFKEPDLERGAYYQLNYSQGRLANPENPMVYLAREQGRLLYSEVSDTVSDVLERADVDAKEVLNGFANQFAYRSVAVSKSLNGWGASRVP
jgi:hypothetical protein